MDRRQYLGLTGTSIVALLGGCSSSDGQENSGGDTTETRTATITPTATATASETPTESPEPTEEPTETPDGSGADITSEHEQFYEFTANEDVPTGTYSASPRRY
jgi:PBP1b-binding outer membrane lipoprotein LpoB